MQVYIWRVDRQADRRTGGEADRRKDRQTDMHECSQHAEQPELKNVLLRTANAGAWNYGTRPLEPLKKFAILYGCLRARVYPAGILNQRSKSPQPVSSFEITCIFGWAPHEASSHASPA